MSRRIEGTARIRDLAGAIQLDLNAGFYTLAGWSDDEENADASRSSSPWVDGDEEDMWRQTSGVIEVSVRIKALTWAEAEAARIDLNAKLKAAPVWLLEREIEGVSHMWRANRPTSIVSPVTTADILNSRRTVVFRVPVQPTPAVTGV